MGVELSKLLGNIGIKWDPEKYQISCMNHVINLAVQEFIKSIKVMLDDDDDDEIERELQEREDNTTAAGFARAMYKIRTITKVQSIILLITDRHIENCHKQPPNGEVPRMLLV